MAISNYEEDVQVSALQAYTLLSMDGLHLLIPRNEIRSLVSVDDIQVAVEAEKNAMGHIVFENGDWPVFSLSRQLNPLHSISNASRICVILHIDDKYMGLLCDQIQNIGQLQTQAMRACMSTADSPISGLLIYENSVACVTSTKHLNTFLATK
ncbi:MAG: hypothetical protein GQ583_01645 [Methyloprofundus sp.]|nr:hypothetical protein [Methyloprofundus sp.]